MTDPAIVQGSEERGLAIFVEDERGDLVDIHYVCYSCSLDCHKTEYENALPWPAYDWPDYCVYCEDCEHDNARTLINVGQDCDCDGEQHAQA